MDHHEAKRLVSEHLRGTGLVAARAARHRDAWVVGYVEADNPGAMLDGGGLVVTAEGEVIDVGSVPGEIDRVLDERELRGEDPDLPRDEAEELRALMASRRPWPGVLDAPVAAFAAVEQLRRAGREVYPARGLELAALALVPFDKVRVVIVGLDPYPTPGHAMGLAFSVPRDVTKLPAGLLSIHVGMRNEGLNPPAHGDLSAWARQGVLLLNRALTFERGKKAGAHLPIWRDYTDQVITVLSERADPVVFVLWGNEAQKVTGLIDTSLHHIITAPHPSSRGAHRRAFQEAGTFGKVNALLPAPIDWVAPS
ncbi:MAG: uracil-DNA glycosylase [Microbacteriaceae bacterium]